MNETTKQPRNSSQAESFNKGITKIHIQAIDNLKRIGYSGKDIEESLKGTNGAIKIKNFDTDGGAFNNIK